MNRAVRALVAAWLRVDLAGAGSPTSTTTIASSSFLSLGLAALTFSPKVWASPYSAAQLTFAAVWVGTAALADPETLSRRRADRLLLRTAPLSTLERSLAIATRHALRITLLAVGLAVGPAVFLVGTRGGSIDGALLQVLATVVAALLATLFTSTIQTLTIGWFGRSGGALTLGVVRALGLAALLTGFATCVGGLRAGLDALPMDGAWADWVPTLWLARLSQGTAHAGDGLRLLAVAAGVVALALLGTRSSDSSVGRLRPMRGLLSTLESRACRTPGSLAIARFLAAQMLRNPAFRARVLPLIGLPVALTVLGFDSDSSAAPAAAGIIAAFPAVFLPLVAALFRTEDDGAAWPFRTAPIDSVRAARRATYAVLAIRLVWPIAVPLAVIVVATGFLGPLAGVSVALFGAVLGDLNAQRIGQRLEAVPFTTEEGASDTGDALMIGLVIAAIAAMFAARADHPLALIFVAGMAVWRLRGLLSPTPDHPDQTKASPI